jgi:hypothetical protein
MKTYRFDYIAWIPSYRDTDIDWTYVDAKTEDEAIEIFQQMPIFKFISPTIDKYNLKPTLDE